VDKEITVGASSIGFAYQGQYWIIEWNDEGRATAMRDGESIALTIAFKMLIMSRDDLRESRNVLHEALTRLDYLHRATQGLTSSGVPHRPVWLEEALGVRRQLG